MGTGATMGVCFASTWVVSIYQMWFSKTPRPVFAPSKEATRQWERLHAACHFGEHVHLRPIGKVNHIPASGWAAYHHTMKRITWR